MSRNTRSATQWPGRAGLCNSRLPTPSAAECDQIVISRLGPNSSSSAEMAIYQALCSAPGATRTPNLLIRRSSSGVHGCPHECIRPLAECFRFHRGPRPSSVIHREWLPTWLPGRAMPATWQQRSWLPRRPKYGAERLIGECGWNPPSQPWLVVVTVGVWLLHRNGCAASPLGHEGAPIRMASLSGRCSIQIPSVPIDLERSCRNPARRNQMRVSSEH
jgi:hypothetical protein